MSLPFTRQQRLDVCRRYERGGPAPVASVLSVRGGTLTVLWSVIASSAAVELGMWEDLVLLVAVVLATPPLAARLLAMRRARAAPRSTRDTRHDMLTLQRGCELEPALATRETQFVAPMRIELPHGDPVDVREFEDTEGRPWCVYEVCTRTPDGGIPSLWFETDGAGRRVQKYPSEWRELPDASLRQLMNRR